MEDKPKKYFIIPQNVKFYYQNDEKIQKKQNTLIIWGIVATVIFGVLQVIAQVGEILVSYFK